MDAPPVPNSRQRIIAAGRSEVEERGILGLRVQDVAIKADVSVPLIYKYFTDRDGLLAAVLSELFEELVLEQIVAAETYFDSIESPTVDDFIAVLAMPQQEFRRQLRWVRVQILAASVEIPALRAQLSVAQLALNERLVRLVENMQTRITGREAAVSSPALALLVQAYAFGFVVNDLMNDDPSAVSNDDFGALMHTLLTAAFQHNPDRSVH